MVEVTQEIPLRLSAETSGWLQQSSMCSDSEDTSSSHSLDIPFREQDDPPDTFDRNCPTCRIEHLLASFCSQTV